jgi:hypothetical protein
MLAETATEIARGRATHAEVEESEADLHRFRAWLAKIAARDYFGVPDAPPPEEAVDRRTRALAEFEAAALAADTGVPSPHLPIPGRSTEEGD